MKQRFKRVIESRKSSPTYPKQLEAPAQTLQQYSMHGNTVDLFRYRANPVGVWPLSLGKPPPSKKIGVFMCK